MTLKQFGLATVAMTVLAAIASQASAQGGLALTGPAPAGVCSFNEDRALAESTVGKYMVQRLTELQTQVKAELQADQNGIQTDAAALEAQKASLSQDQYQSQGQALQSRVAALQHKAQQRDGELQATQRSAVQTIGNVLGPIVQAVATSRSCTVLISAEALIIPNPSIDITNAATAQLNAKLTQFAIERVHLDQGGAPGQ